MLEKLKHGAIDTLGRVLPSPWEGSAEFRVLVQTPYGFDARLWQIAIGQEIPDWPRRLEMRFASGGLPLSRSAREADVVSLFDLNADLVRLCSHARWINALLSGVDLQALSLVGEGVRVTSSRGIAARSMAEYAMTYFLALRNHFPAALQYQQEWRWSDEGQLQPPGPLDGLVAAVFGLGAAGVEVARLCRSIGMRTIGIRRDASQPHPDCDELCSLPEFHRILPRVDLAVLTLPVSDTTRHLFTEVEFERMKPSAILVNVSRGDLIREDHLAVALRSGKIAGAGLDVLSQEPPPRGHPLRDCPNLILTPHVAGNIQRFREPIAARFARNLRAFLEGAPLEGLI
jgi:phosphoglycerate dehydrogenase-like enzyme